jgi:hypothetical protein
MKTRIGVFETNSSSSHSITISGPASVPDTLPVIDGVLKVFPGEFGWGPDKYNDAAKKASYCLTWLRADDNENGGLLQGNEDMFREVLQEATGAVRVEFVPRSDDYHPWGYIDHQSDGECAQAFRSKESLKNFIFNPESQLIIDNDNHNPYDYA